MPTIPQFMIQPIREAYPDHTLMVGSILPNGYPQFTPRGSLYVYDSEHLAMWERGSGTTNDNLQDGTKLTIVYRNMEMRANGLLPSGGIARFYGTAKLIKDGPVRDQIYDGIIKHEQWRDAEKKGFAVLIKIERAEHISGKPLLD
jgi:hypothetical protein